MSRHLYALLVGINDYPQPVPSLSGCVRDMEGWLAYLERYAKKQGYEFCPLVLRNQEATRQALIDGFNHHLCQAQQDDVVVFCFAGHGSEAPGQKAFGQKPEELNQTLVCSDSRLEGGWDLVDKELSALVAAVAKNEPQITLILDCCHSGSGSRDFGERRVEAQCGERPWESYCFAKPQEKEAASRSLGQAANDGFRSDAFQLVQGRHILMAACHETETAKEVRDSEGYRGVFSLALQRVLAESERELTYAELVAQAKQEIRVQGIREQEPQLEVILGDEDERQRFFLREERQADSRGIVELSCDAQGWRVAMGAVQGWPENEANPEIELAVFPFGHGPKAIRKGKGQLAVARVTAVASTFSRVMVEGQALDPGVLYKALITKAPTPALTVFLQGKNALGVDTLRRSIKSMGTERVKVKEVSDPAEAMIVLQAEERQYGVVRGPLMEEPRRAAMAYFPYTPPVETNVVEPLVHVAQWQQLKVLENPRVGIIPRDGLSLELVHNGRVFTAPELVLDYKQGSTPKVALRLVNHTDLRLYCAVFELSSEFSIQSNWFETGSGLWVEPRQSVDVETFEYEISEELKARGVVEERNWYKLIASAEPFEPQVWEQGYLSDPPHRRSTASRQKKAQKDWMTREVLVWDLGPDQGFRNEVVDAEELLKTDEAVLFAALGQLLERSPRVKERPVELTAEVLERSPRVKERPVVMRSELEVLLEGNEALVRRFEEPGRQAFAALAPQVGGLPGIVINQEEADVAQAIEQLLKKQEQMNSVSQHTQVLAQGLTSYLNWPQPKAYVFATLLMRNVNQ